MKPNEKEMRILNTPSREEQLKALEALAKQQEDNPNTTDLGNIGVTELPSLNQITIKKDLEEGKQFASIENITPYLSNGQTKFRITWQFDEVYDNDMRTAQSMQTLAAQLMYQLNFKAQNIQEVLDTSKGKLVQVDVSKNGMYTNINVTTLKQN